MEAKNLTKAFPVERCIELLERVIKDLSVIMKQVSQQDKRVRKTTIEFYTAILSHLKYLKELNEVNKKDC